MNKSVTAFSVNVLDIAQKGNFDCDFVAFSIRLMHSFSNVPFHITPS